MNHIVEICVSTPEELKEAMSLSKYCFWRKSVISIHYNYGVEKIRREIREIDRALLEKSLAVIDGHEEDEQYINYGSSGLRGELEYKD